MQKKSKAKNASLVLGLFLTVLIGLSACGDKNQLLQTNSSLSFTQDYNPPLLDILWVLDDRSQFYSAPGRSHIVEEAKQFFTRLDSSTASYQMGFITADMLNAQGRLQPVSSPIILKKNMGTLAQRVSLFSSLLTQVAFNGRTSGVNKAFEATAIALTSGFKPRTNVPLVIVFLSDSDDRSSVPSSQSAVTYYGNLFLSLKGNNPDLLRVYSINYERLAQGEAVNSSNRCVTLYNADIDGPNFQDRFFQLADRLNGESSGICGAFSDNISLAGLRARELPKRFKLDVAIQPSTLRVVVSLNGEELDGLSWSFDETTNEVVFNQAPPEGSRIDISYLGL
ncbi:hypothetical protein EBQ74_02275 [bacterium]|jgi:hypothetical protein|nr:hypothetical protein [bacterium]